AAADTPVGPEEAAELAHLLEVEELKVAGGKQDQYAAALGGFLYLEFDDPAVSVTRLPVDPSFVQALLERFVLCYTGTSRISGDTIARVMSRFEKGDQQIVSALDELRDAAAAAREAMMAGDIEALAEVISRNWSHQRALDAAMATPEMDRVEAEASAAGAIGCKACGAGAGGCMVFITASGAIDEVRRAIESAGAEILPFEFDSEGVRSESSAP
ncbi:MAG: GHMP kinase, partial [Myxococcota bacterium]